MANRRRHARPTGMRQPCSAQQCEVSQHSTLRSVAAATALGLAALALPALAQETPPDYIPLFSKEQIEQASPEAKSRMIETEERNRKAWIERSKQEPSGDTPLAQDENQRAAAPRATPRKRKIYRWVDAQGRVNFGDTPPSGTREEVNVRGTAPPTGANTQPRRLITESE